MATHLEQRADRQLDGLLVRRRDVVRVVLLQKLPHCHPRPQPQPLAPWQRPRPRPRPPGRARQGQAIPVVAAGPTAFAFQAEYVPEGSVEKRRAVPSGSKPITRVAMPNGRTPPLCVYFCAHKERNSCMTGTD
jgi:hypothetical protein